MKRTKLCDRALPDYTRGEEIFNMVSHIAGGGLGIIITALCVAFAAMKGNVWAVVSCSIYGASLIMLYTVSSVYHGIRKNTAKKVMQVIDHCTIYFLIAGTYTPMLLCAIRNVSPTAAWVLFGLVWGLTVLATTLTAIDLKKYTVFSMICYIGIGWCIALAPKALIASVRMPGVILLLAGGIAYTIGAILYGVGKKCRYMHSVFHLFVVLGSVLQFLCIFLYVI